MSSPYDTPAEGDFARYVEQLGRPAQAAPSRSRPVAPRRATGLFAPVRRVVQLGLVLCVAYLMLAPLIPALRPWGGSLALGFAVYAWLQLRGLPWRGLSMAVARQHRQSPHAQKD